MVNHRIKALAQKALDVQDACNGVAVAISYGETLKELREALRDAELPCGTDDLRSHPVNRLWASKIHDMANLGLSDYEKYNEAYEWCIVTAAAE